MSIRKPGSLTCWPSFQITPPTKSPTCFHGIGRRTNSSRTPLLPERFAADHRACPGCWPDAYLQTAGSCLHGANRESANHQCRGPCTIGGRLCLQTWSGGETLGLCRELRSAVPAPTATHRNQSRSVGGLFDDFHPFVADLCGRES